MTQDWSHYSLQGCIFDDTAHAAPLLEAHSSQLPPRVDLRIHCPPVEDQKRTNSCVAQAVVGALETHQKKAGLPLTDMSRLFVYWNARKLSGNTHSDTGTLNQMGMAALMAYGACEEQLWPFQEAAVLAEPDARCYQNAAKHEAIQFARTPHGEAALTALAEGFPVVFGMYAPMEFYQVAHKTGVMPEPGQVPTRTPPAGHAMLLVGYDLEDRTYLVRNSYGEQFADRGYFRIPFNTLSAWSRERDYWTIGAIEQAAAFKLTGASMEDAMIAVGVDPEAVEIGGKPLDRMRSDLRARLSSDLESAKRDFRGRLRGK